MKITYQRAYSIGPFLQEKIGFEIEIPDDGDAMDEIQTLKDLADHAHGQLNPHLIDNSQPVESVITHSNSIPTTQVEKSPIDSHIEAINGCTSLKSLDIFRKLVDRQREQYPELGKAFDNKHNELQ